MTCNQELLHEYEMKLCDRRSSPSHRRIRICIALMKFGFYAVDYDSACIYAYPTQFDFYNRTKNPFFFMSFAHAISIIKMFRAKK